MGLGTQMIAWPEELCELLAGRGLYVLRFDNRDAGRSTHVDCPPPTTMELLRRRFDRRQYTLFDMADDAARLLLRLELAPAHVVGASLGGMIAQTLAAERPECVRSLVSIMSSTGSRWHGQPAPGLYRYFLRRPPRSRDDFIERAIEVFGVIGSPDFERDEEWIRDRAGKSFDRGHDPYAAGRQLAAALAAGDRTRLLRKIRAPTLVVHGARDRLVSPSGGRATASAIPGAGLMLIEGMGHDLPRPLWPKLIDAIAEHAAAADSNHLERRSGEGEPSLTNA